MGSGLERGGNCRIAGEEEREPGSEGDCVYKIKNNKILKSCTEEKTDWDKGRRERGSEGKKDRRGEGMNGGRERGMRRKGPVSQQRDAKKHLTAEAIQVIWHGHSFPPENPGRRRPLTADDRSCPPEIPGRRCLLAVQPDGKLTAPPLENSAGAKKSN